LLMMLMMMMKDRSWRWVTLRSSSGYFGIIDSRQSKAMRQEEKILSNKGDLT